MPVFPTDEGRRRRSEARPLGRILRKGNPPALKILVRPRDKKHVSQRCLDYAGARVTTLPGGSVILETAAGKFMLTPSAFKHVVGEMAMAGGPAGGGEIAEELSMLLTKASIEGFEYGVPVVIEGFELVIVRTTSTAPSAVQSVLIHVQPVGKI